MKHLVFTILLWAFGSLSFAQNTEFDRRRTEKSLAKISDNLYASKFEVSNKQYVDFLLYLKQNNLLDKLETAQLDTSNWSATSSSLNPYSKFYHSHPAYYNYPVVNVSYEGANLYCEYLSEQYNASKKRKFNKVEFRLPTEEEWITAAKAGDQLAIYPWEGNEFETKKGELRCNLKRDSNDMMGTAYKYNDNADITAPVNWYSPNNFGLFNMSGNVAEMVNSKGKTKGGSWLDKQEAMKIESVGHYTDGDSNGNSIGFRYFMEVIDK